MFFPASEAEQTRPEYVCGGQPSNSHLEQNIPYFVYGGQPSPDYAYAGEASYGQQSVPDYSYGGEASYVQQSGVEEYIEEQPPIVSFKTEQVRSCYSDVR